MNLSSESDFFDAYMASAQDNRFSCANGIFAGVVTEEIIPEACRMLESGEAFPFRNFGTREIPFVLTWNRLSRSEPCGIDEFKAFSDVFRGLCRARLDSQISMIATALTREDLAAKISEIMAAERILMLKGILIAYDGYEPLSCERTGGFFGIHMRNWAPALTAFNDDLQLRALPRNGGEVSEPDCMPDV